MVVAVAHPVAPISHAAVGADWIVVAVVGNVWVVEVNVVEVAVTFQPEPDPVASPISTVSGAVIDWLVPFSVVVGKVIVAAGVLLMNERLPALSVTDAAVVACEAAGSSATPAIASAEHAASPRKRFLTIFIFGPPISASLTSRVTPSSVVREQRGVFSSRKCRHLRRQT